MQELEYSTNDKLSGNPINKPHQLEHAFILTNMNLLKSEMNENFSCLSGTVDLTLNHLMRFFEVSLLPNCEMTSLSASGSTITPFLMQLSTTLYRWKQTMISNHFGSLEVRIITPP